ncbi:M48 family metalloprotease [Marinomonas epiphytica]
MKADTPDIGAVKNERSLANPGYVLGQHWFRKLNGSRALIDFPPAYDYLKDAVATLTPQTRLNNKLVEMTLLNSSQSNAFVIPGNHLFIYSDILEMINNENMLFALLAHELAHLELQHYERQKQQSSQELSKALLLIGAGIAASLAGADGDTTTALWLGGIANQAENTLSYSRDQEQEADRRGREYLAAAGFPADSMSQLFHAFFKRALGRPSLEFLSTHPSPQTRLADSLSFEQPASLLSQQHKTDFDYFRASILAYRAGLSDQPMQYLAQQITNLNASYFARALFSYLVNQPEQALDFLNQVDQSNEFTLYLKALIFHKQQEKDSALQAVDAVLKLNPRNLLFSTLKAEINRQKAPISSADYLYEKRLIWRTNIQHYQKFNPNLALSYKALLDFSQGKDKEAQLLIRRAIRDIPSSNRHFPEAAQQQFDLIMEAEKQAGLED